MCSNSDKIIILKKNKNTKNKNSLNKNLSKKIFEANGNRLRSIALASDDEKSIEANNIYQQGWRSRESYGKIKIIICDSF